MDLFQPSLPPALPPLAERMRPARLEDLVGQQHLMAEDSPFRRAVSGVRIPSMIFWGPPGVGKTTLAQIIAQTAQRPFRQLSAISSGVKEVREVLQFAEGRPGTILFLDEIHRFNKAQQDSLLAAVEKGRITLIGATTENPSFEVNAALLSRCQVYVLHPLEEADVRELIARALAKDPVLARRRARVETTEALHRLSGGDARKALTLLELTVGLFPDTDEAVISDETVQQAAQTHIALYDKSGEMHYDLISAFIKSVRGGDPNAAVYYLARMLDGGEDVSFIARRLIILASEDIGNANPNALLLANACFQSVNVIGMPEARIILGQTATYLATSEKSNAAYAAINEAMQFVQSHAAYPVPLHLRNAPTRLMKQQGYGAGYKYSHEHAGEPDHQEFLPEEMKGARFYRPKPVGSELKILRFLEEHWAGKYTG
ncbi:MAG: replication-associated recombination protein A [Bacteroidia bacterium]|nr:replication-associated recombination protein A [Bacteroidia bacterium]